jgi:hypothetical protein
MSAVRTRETAISDSAHRKFPDPNWFRKLGPSQFMGKCVI